MRFTYAGLVEQIRGAISRGNGTFGIGHSNLPPQDPPFTLILGSVRARTVDGKLLSAPGGYIVSLGLTIEQVEKLRDECGQLLLEHEGPKVERKGRLS
jgi:hypothetical protein